MSSPRARPGLQLRGRSFMALVLVPASPVPAWLAALDGEIARSPALFRDRPVVLDAVLLPRGGAETRDLPASLADRGLRVIGVENAPAGLEHLAWSADVWGGRPTGLFEVREAAPAAPEPPPELTALTVTEPVRSGQSIVFPRGDVTVIGAVASGAEVLAGGSIHIYGKLRGRAVAGLNGVPGARVFCRGLDAELISIDGYYRTAEEWDSTLRGRPVHAWVQGESLFLAPLD